MLRHAGSSQAAPGQFVVEVSRVTTLRQPAASHSPASPADAFLGAFLMMPASTS